MKANAYSLPKVKKENYDKGEAKSIVKLVAETAARVSQIVRANGSGAFPVINTKRP